MISSDDGNGPFDVFVEVGEVCDHPDLVGVLLGYEECWTAPVSWGFYLGYYFLLQQIVDRGVGRPFHVLGDGSGCGHSCW